MILATVEAYQTKTKHNVKSKHYVHLNYHKLPDTISANNPKIVILFFL